MSERLIQLEDFLKESPNDPFLKYAITMEHLKLGAVEKAIEGFEVLVAQHEDYVGTYYHFGKLLEKLGNSDRALQTYQRGMEVARSKRNMHALNELQQAYRIAVGLDEDDD